MVSILKVSRRRCSSASIKKIGEQRFKWFYEITIVMKNVGRVKLVIPREIKNSKTFTFLVCNDTSLDGMQVLEYYKKQ